MRWLTLLLIVVNLGLFGFYWQRQQVEAQLQQQRVALPDVPAWQLLSERGESPTRPGAVAASESVTAPEVAPVAGAEGPAAPVSGISDRESGGDEADAEVAEVVQPQSREAVVDGSAGEDLVEADKVPAPAASCYRLASFASLDEAEAALGLWEVSSSRIDESRSQLEPDYWVYIEAPGSSTERRTLRNTLTDMGLDNYWVQRGVLKGQLSLGLYRNKESAEALLDMLTGRGYPAKIYLKPRFQTRYVVELVTLSSPAETQKALAETVARWGSVKSEKKLCQGLASAQLPE